jgi:flavodoxin
MTLSSFESICEKSANYQPIKIIVNKMRVLIICQSIHHQNTLKIAQILAQDLKAKLVKPQDIKPEEVLNYDLVGFGSGIYFGKHHKNLLELVDKLTFSSVARVNNENFSVSSTKNLLRSTDSKFFSSNGALEDNPTANKARGETLLTKKKIVEQSPRKFLPISKDTFIFSTSGVSCNIWDGHWLLRQKLLRRKFKIAGEFNCLGWDTFGPYKLIGGLNRNHPDKKDLQKTREFVGELRVRSCKGN